MDEAARPPELAELREREETPVDPYPDLPTIAQGELRDGDVLLMLGTGWSRVPPLPFEIPISWLIRTLDGGSYSHAAIVTREEDDSGAARPRVWDHSRDWSLGPVPVDDALVDHAWCHVYRFEKDGEELGDPRFPRARVPEAVRPHRGDPYDKQLLLFAGLVALLSRMPERAWVRRCARVALDTLVRVLKRLLDDEDVRKGAFVCTGVPGIAFWEAREDVPHDYALEVDVERRRGLEPVEDVAWEETLQRVREVLRRVLPDLDTQLASWRDTVFRSNAWWVPVGSDGLPVNLVSPSDLECSRTLRRVAKLAVPGG
ncbi:MAG: hypothetical protein R3263_00095 [Myxococcota bacterium]|nr:hypothetical protein [Myxococcota bacterium]